MLFEHIPNMLPEGSLTSDISYFDDLLWIRETVFG